MEDMLFVAAAMCVVNVTSEQDFTPPSPEDEALAKKLVEILEVNKRSTAEFFRILKVLKTMNGRELPSFDAARVKKMKERLS